MSPPDFHGGHNHQKDYRMVQDYQVTCIIPDASDKDRRIDSIGGATGGQGAGGSWCISLDEAIKGIEDQRWSFWTQANGKSVWVVVAKRNGKKYLKTTADGDEPNNLLSLPRCR